MQAATLAPAQLGLTQLIRPRWRSPCRSTPGERGQRAVVLFSLYLVVSIIGRMTPWHISRGLLRMLVQSQQLIVA